MINLPTCSHVSSLTDVSRCAVVSPLEHVRSPQTRRSSVGAGRYLLAGLVADIAWCDGGYAH